MNNKNNPIYVLIGSVLIVFGVFLGLFLGENKNPQNQFASKYGQKMAAILHVIDQKYVDTVNKNHLFEETVSKLLHELDPHSNYISAENLKQVNESIRGKYGGVGIRFTIYQDTLDVVNVIPNSPSAAVNIQKFDQIIAVNGKNIAGVKLTNQEVREMLKGEAGSPVNVTILRQGKSLQKTIVRGEVPIKTIVAQYMMTNEIGYIRLSQFSMNSDKEFYRAALKLKAQGMKKLILDLRFNGGGVLGSAVGIIETFLKKGTIIVSTKGKSSPERIIRADGDDFLRNIELAVLINSSSASASEITAGAIQDNDRGIIIGRRSFGKGLVQRDFHLKDGSDLRLTIARYYTPTGRCIQKPYENGYKNYIMDEYRRFEDGELYHIDSSKFVDSLKYITPGGRVVYGGGGIMPDIFVPLDTTGGSSYFRLLRHHNVFNHFSYQYARKHDLGKFANLKDFDQNFHITAKLINDFTTYAEKQYAVKYDKNGFNHSEERIKTRIKVELARQRWLESGAFYILNQTNKDVLKAKKALLKYDSVLGLH